MRISGTGNHKRHRRHLPPEQRGVKLQSFKATCCVHRHVISGTLRDSSHERAAVHASDLNGSAAASSSAWSPPPFVAASGAAAAVAPFAAGSFAASPAEARNGGSAHLPAMLPIPHRKEGTMTDGSATTSPMVQLQNTDSTESCSGNNKGPVALSTACSEARLPCPSTAACKLL